MSVNTDVTHMHGIADAEYLYTYHMRVLYCKAVTSKGIFFL